MEVTNSNAKRKYESAMPNTDEGWWESVLAEERMHAPARPQQAATKVNPAAPQVKLFNRIGMRSKSYIPMTASFR